MRAPKLDDTQRKLALMAENSLAEFIRLGWKVIEPATKYVHGWHLDAISEHLEAVTNGQITRLLINIPPRHMKSLSVSVFWPAWEWIKNPGKRYICASYAQSLATRDSVKCRRIIQSRWYRARWKEKFQLTGDQNSKIRFENTAEGFRLATSVDGMGTGEGGDRIIVDDPLSAKEALSETKRKAALDWWDQVMSTRLNNPETGAYVIVMQRLHEEDLAGHVLEEGGYVHLKLPAEYEGERFFSTASANLGIMIEDPRGEIDELLWPARVSRKAIEKMKKSLGSYGVAGQLQQRPSPKGGGIFKRAWWQFYREQPRFTRVIQSWDTAFKAGDTNAFSVGQTWGEAINGYYLLDLRRGRWEFPELKREVKAFCDKHNPSAVLIEDKASGQSLAQEIKAGSTMPVLPIPVAEGDKIVRSHVVAPTVEAGKVFLPESAEWLSDFLDELERFPASAYADQVDSFTQAIEWMRREKGKIINAGAVQSAIQAGGNALDLKGKKVEALDI